MASEEGSTAPTFASQGHTRDYFLRAWGNSELSAAGSSADEPGAAQASRTAGPRGADASTRKQQQPGMARVELVEDAAPQPAPSTPPGEAPKQVPAAAPPSKEGMARPREGWPKAGIRAGFFDKSSSAGRRTDAGSKDAGANASTSNVTSPAADSRRLGRGSNGLSEKDNSVWNSVAPQQQRSPVAEEAGLAVSATEEKERGNDLYRMGRFEEAARCYSHSLALEPTAVAFANRAMVFLKLGRYEEAERDCTEALERDDEYVKALSRRATARLKLKRPLAALQDVCAALELEPGSRDLLQLKATIETAALRRAPSATAPAAVVKPETTELLPAEARGSTQRSAAARSTGPGSTEGEPSDGAEPAIRLAGSGRALDAQVSPESDGGAEVASTSRIANAAALGPGAMQAAVPSPGATQKGTAQETTARGLHADPSVWPTADLVSRSLELLERQRMGGQPLLTVADAADKALPGSVAVTLRRPPKSAYEFEEQWRALQQTEKVEGHIESAEVSRMLRRLRLLKSMPAEALPALLKDSLSGPLLMDLLRTVLRSLDCPAVPQLAGADHLEWAVAFLVALARTPRFQIASLCLTRSMRAEVQHLWEQAFGQGRLEWVPGLSTDLLVVVSDALQIKPCGLSS